DVAMHAGLLDGLALAVLMRDASADRLITQPKVAIEPVGRGAKPLVLEPDRVVAHDGVLDIGDDLLPGDRLDVMGVDVADEPVLQAAPDRVAPGVREDIAGVGMNGDLLDRRKLRPDPALDVHDLSPAE